jgi:flagellar biosynthesis/type III secretory pathway protein FliH
MQMTYEEKVEARGVKKGLEQGLEQGLEKGLEQGREKGRVEGMRAVVLGLLDRRFGPLSSATREKLEGIATAEELSRLADRVLDAQSVEDLGL